MCCWCWGGVVVVYVVRCWLLWWLMMMMMMLLLLMMMMMMMSPLGSVSGKGGSFSLPPSPVPCQSTPACLKCYCYFKHCYFDIVIAIINIVILILLFLSLNTGVAVQQHTVRFHRLWGKHFKYEVWSMVIPGTETHGPVDQVKHLKTVKVKIDQL